jgi:serine/threonine-protein kinase
MNTTINKARILCVDDEPGILRALTWVLKKEYHIATAGSGEEALKILQDHDFEVIISDQRMPGMMGADLLEKVRQLCPRAIRILLTGYSDIEYILDSINKGEIFRFIKKPWDIPDLKRIVGEAVAIAISSENADEATVVPRSNAPKILLIDDDQEVINMVKDIVENKQRLLIATNIAEAIVALSEPDKIGVLISDLNVNEVDVSRLLKILKSKAPEIATVVVSSRSDIQDVISLINQGQVYRFIFKPIKRGALKLLIHSALDKHSKLKREPGSSHRHKVEKLSKSDLESLKADVKAHAAKASVAESLEEAGILKRFSSGLSRLFNG